MNLFVKVTHYTKSKLYRAVIFCGSGKILGNATCQNCPRVAANAAVSKTYGLPAAATITEIPANLAWTKRGSENEVFFYRFTFNPAGHAIQQP
jgi:hypothetical protein